MPTANIVEHSFQSRSDLVDALSVRVSEGLRRAMATNGCASLGASGGSTPRPLYEALSRSADVPWGGVTIALLDERWVDQDHPASNAAMVRGALLRGPAQAARFVGLKTDHPAPANAIDVAAATLYSALTPPLDVVVLGMGADGHTLSWFPHAENLWSALDPSPGGVVTWLRALPSEVTGDHVDRISLTLGAVRGASELALMITGPEKREAFDAALADGPVEEMPIRALLRDDDVTIHVFWSP